MDEEQAAEALALQRQINEYFNTLVVSGMTEGFVVSNAMVAISERVMKASSPIMAATWLRSAAIEVEQNGPAMMRALRGG